LSLPDASLPTVAESTFRSAMRGPLKPFLPKAHKLISGAAL